jgi:hypothetical protein
MITIPETVGIQFFMEVRSPSGFFHHNCTAIQCFETIGAKIFDGVVVQIVEHLLTPRINHSVDFLNFTAANITISFLHLLLLTFFRSLTSKESFKLTSTVLTQIAFPTAGILSFPVVERYCFDTENIMDWLQVYEFSRFV